MRIGRTIHRNIYTITPAPFSPVFIVTTTAPFPPWLVHLLVLRRRLLCHRFLRRRPLLHRVLHRALYLILPRVWLCDLEDD